VTLMVDRQLLLGDSCLFSPYRTSVPDGMVLCKCVSPNYLFIGACDLVI
jgi:hypothetical protein